MIPTREQALELLKAYNHEEWHIRHALAVEAVMRHFAALLGTGDEERWAVVGLLHDIDFEWFPDQHCVKAQEILREHGVDEQIVRAVACHGWGLTAVEYRPEHVMEKVLFATDELTGLITACAIMRPSKSLLDLELSSVKKKFKTPAFAAGCNRQVITDGAAMLGMDLDEMIAQTILGMRTQAEALGLKGNL